MSNMYLLSLNMENTRTRTGSNATMNFFYKANLIVFLLGLPNFWIEDLKLSKIFVKFYKYFSKLNDSLIVILIAAELGSFFTQFELSEKQRSNLLIFCISHPLVFGFRYIVAYHEDEVRNLIHKLVFKLKEVHNDVEVEKNMIRKATTFSLVLIISCVIAVGFYTIDGYFAVLKGNTFTIIVTIWPDVKDTSAIANIGRITFYIIWWIYISRVFAVYIVVLCLTVCLSHQYINLQRYFYSLDDIFENSDMSQDEKEIKYEEAFKICVQNHCDTFECTSQYQIISRSVVNGQIILNMLLLVLLMAEMTNSERTMVGTVNTVMTASVVLISTGLFMWNAGDITVEASRLATAMYFSGWHKCQGDSSLRIRKLVVTALTGAQKPVILRGLLIVDLSYQSYLSIVKSAYSVFSVLY